MADAEQLAILEQGVEAWNQWRAENPGARIDLRGARLRRKQLNHINLAKSDLTEANISFASLKGANLAFANLENAILSFANLTGANLSATSLSDAYIEDAVLTDARLQGTNLKRARLTNSDLKSAYLVDANVTGANLSAVNFENANLSSIIFDQRIIRSIIKKSGFSFKKLWERRYDVLLDTTIRCKGVNATTCFGSQRFKIFLQDQDFLEEFLDRRWGKRFFFTWWLFADCGRSLSRWAGWSFLLAMFFAFVFWCLGPDSFNTEYLEFNLLTTFYYSVVTFTTLGFGDIIPKTSAAALVVTLEVIIGYIMLGGLITIFASKLSRRGV